jgi:hypothetical protein
MSDEKSYKDLFGLTTESDKSKNEKSKHATAWEKAWEIRNFEIDKFWTRTAFFWGFVALIFGAYVAVISGERSDIAIKIHLDLYLILLGCIFSVAWLLVILGSKRWQENWEKHIDELEDALTGPLYKTVYFKSNKPFYSVSKINEKLAWVVIATWFLLFLQYVFDKFESLSTLIVLSKNCFFILLPIIGTIIFIVFLWKCCGRSSFDKYRKKSDKKGKFINIKTGVVAKNEVI